MRNMYSHWEQPGERSGGGGASIFCVVANNPPSAAGVTSSVVCVQVKIVNRLLFFVDDFFGFFNFF